MELPETSKRQRPLAALSPGGSNKKKKAHLPVQSPGDMPPPSLRPKYTVKILTPLEPFVRCEDEWGMYMDSPPKPPESEDMEREPADFMDKYDDRPESPGNMSDGPSAEAPVAVHAMQISFEPSSPAFSPLPSSSPVSPLPPPLEAIPMEKQICRTRLDKKLIECRYGDRCKFSHDCPRCPGLSHAAIHCPKPLYTIRILGPMVPVPRPSPGATPAFDPLSPYNSSSFLMSESHPPAKEEPADDWDYGSMDNVPCEYLYGAWMQSPAQIPRPAPQDLLEEEDFVLASD